MKFAELLRGEQFYHGGRRLEFQGGYEPATLYVKESDTEAREVEGVGHLVPFLGDTEITPRTKLLAFAERVANHHSEKIHAFHGGIIITARQVVKAEGGRLEKLGRYEAGSASPKPHEKYRDGHWIHPKLNKVTDEWEFPTC